MMEFEFHHCKKTNAEGHHALTRGLFSLAEARALTLKVLVRAFPRTDSDSFFLYFHE